MTRKSFEPGINQSGDLFQFRPIKHRETKKHKEAEPLPRNDQPLMEYLKTLPPKPPKLSKRGRSGELLQDD